MLEKSSAALRVQRTVLRRPFFWLAVCVAFSFAVLAYPLYVIRPFRSQGARELAVALAVTRVTPFLEILLAVCGLALAILCWRGGRNILRRVAAAIGALLVLLFAGLSRVNIYELLFHPIDVPQFAHASDVKLDGKEEVIAIRIGQVARAYPVRSISYHHIVNDLVDGVPVVATY